MPQVKTAVTLGSANIMDRYSVYTRAIVASRLTFRAAEIVIVYVRFRDKDLQVHAPQLTDKITHRGTRLRTGRGKMALNPDGIDGNAALPESAKQ